MTTAEKIKEFDCNPANSHNCEECPRNNGFSGWQNRLPCGQQNCWVDVTCQEGD